MTGEYGRAEYGSHEVLVDVAAFSVEEDDVTQLFYISQNRLNDKAPNFKADWDNPDMSAYRNSLQISTFYSFADWLAGAPLIKVSYYWRRWHKLMPIFNLYLFGWVFGILELCADTLHEISNFMRSHLAEINRSADWRRKFIIEKVAQEEIEFVHEHTLPGSDLRNIFVHHLCAVELEKWTTPALLSGYNKECLMDMMMLRSKLKGYELGSEHAEKLCDKWRPEDEGCGEMTDDEQRQQQ